MSEFINNINNLRSLAESWLELDTLTDAPVLNSVGRYSVLAGGKRIRAVLVLLAADVLGVERERVRPIAVAVELIHAASLIHDDLPALDDDALRRGKPTTHIEFGEDIAIVAGDALLAEGIHVVTRSPHLSDAEQGRVAGLLARTIVELCEGQALDLRASEAQESEQALQNRHRLKTGSLIAAAACAPALLDGPHDRKSCFNHLKLFGLSLGLLFQITDDLLDVTGSTELLGKEAHADERQDTPTYVSLLGLDRARERAGELVAEAKAQLDRLPGNTEQLASLCDFVFERDR